MRRVTRLVGLVAVVCAIGMASPTVVDTVAADAPACGEVTYDGSGDANDPYEIENVSQLQCINADLDAHYELVSDVDASDTESWNEGKGFEPIGSCTDVGEADPWERCSGQQFTRTFDGNSHTVSGLTIDRPDTNGVGLFAAADEAQFTNLRLASVNITGSENTGGLAGQLVSDDIDTKDGFVGNVSVNGTVTGELDTAGVVGHGVDITLEDQIVFTGTVKGSDEVGGILGRSSEATAVSTSYVRATVEANGTRGRVHGDNADAGGLVGNSGNPSDFMNVYTVGSVSGDVAGSIVGGGNDPSTFEDVYWDTKRGPNDAIGGYESNGVVTALSTAEMQGVTAEENMDFDWAGTWQSVAGAYPVFQWEAAAVGESSIAGIDAPDTTAVVRETGEVTVVATDKFGNRLESESISVDATDGLSGINTGDTETTHSNGQATFTFTEEMAGTYDLTFSADESITDAATVTIREGVNCAVVEYSGDGSTDDPYEIDSLAKLQCINQDLDAHYELVSGIDASETSEWNGGKGFEPIGSTAEPFNGSFDGNESTIFGVIINRPQTDGIGLFGHVGADGEVRNATLGAAEVTGGDEVGVVVGDSAGSVTNVTASGNVTGSNYVGGLVGYSGGVVTNATTSGNVTGDGYYLGGLIGYVTAGGKILNSYATGDVSSSASWAVVGGLVGDSSGERIADSFATGNVTTDGENVGGLVGIHRSGNITNVTSSGAVSGTSNVGGLIGKVSHDPDRVIRNASATGNVTASGTKIGGFVGLSASGSGTVIDSVARGDVNVTEGYSRSTALAGGFIGKNQFTTLTNVSASGDVYIPDANRVGGLVGENNGESLTDAIARGNVSGDGDVGGLIGRDACSSELIVNATATGQVTATGDDVGGLIGFSTCSKAWENIRATGHVMGDKEVGGLVGDVRSEIELINATASGDVEGTQYVGGLAGELLQPTITDATATGDVTSTATAGSSYAGGLIGEMPAGTISASAATGNVTAAGSHAGGLVGLLQDAEFSDNPAQINESYATGDVTGNQSVGGLAGKAIRTNITNTYATGSVDGNASLGGLVGNVSGGTVTLSYAVGAVADEPAAGGLIGTVHNSPTVQNTYWDNQTTERTSSAGDGAQSLRTVELKGDTAKTNATGFDFQNTWGVRSGTAVSYPYLRNNTQSPPPGLESPFAGGTGSESSPFEIENWYHLDNVSRFPGANYTLLADLNSSTTGYDEVANTSANDEKGFEPVGSGEQRFVGTFDGNDQNISDLYINRTDEDRVGLFKRVPAGQFGTGTVHNLDLVNVHIAGGNRTGAVAGAHSGARTIENISVTGYIDGDRMVGGVVGFNVGHVRNVSVDGTVNGSIQVGGVIGHNRGGTLNASSAVGTVTGDGAVGGLVGDNSAANPIGEGGTILNSHAGASVEAYGLVGGLVGANGDKVQPVGQTSIFSGGTITNSSASGTVAVTVSPSVTGERAGGLVGQMYLGNITRSSASATVGAPNATHVGGLVGYADGTEPEPQGGGQRLIPVRTIRESYATGDVTGNESVGGLVGTTRNETVVHSYAVGNVTGDTAVGGLVGTHTGANANVTGAYAAGVVSDGGGGLIGSTHGSSTVDDAYWDSTRTTRESSAGSGSNLTTAAMTGGDALADGNMDGFDEQLWLPVTAETPGSDGNGYPVLQSLSLTPQLLAVESDSKPSGDPNGDTEAGPRNPTLEDPVVPPSTTPPRDDHDDDDDDRRRARGADPGSAANDDTPTTRVSLDFAPDQPESTPSQPETTPDDGTKATSDDLLDEDGEDTPDAPTPEVNVRVENPQPGQTLVITGDQVRVVADDGVIEDVQSPVPEPNSAETSPPSEEATDSAADTSRSTESNDNTPVSNVRADRMTVELDTDRDFALSVTTYESDLTPSAAIRSGTPGNTDSAAAVRGGDLSLRAVDSTVRANGFALAGLVRAPPQTDPPSAPREVTTAAASFETTTDTVAAGYVDVEHTLTPDELRGATLEFSIRRAYLTQLGVDPERVTLYHRTSNGTWSIRNTTLVGSDATHHRYEGSMPGFSVFTLGTGAPRVTLTEASLASQSVRLGEPVRATATLVNRGQTHSETTVPLTRDGAVLDQATVTVPGETTRVIELAYTPESSGSASLSVGSMRAGSVTVDRSRTSVDEETAPTAADGVSTSVPVVAIILVVLLVALVGGIWARQRTERPESAGASPVTASNTDAIEATPPPIDDAEASQERDVSDSKPPRATDATRSTATNDPSAESEDTASEERPPSETDESSEER